MNPAPTGPVPSVAQPVLLYDAECGLCQRCVHWLARQDRARRLRFAPLQGSTGQRLLRAWGLPTEDFDSMVWVPPNGAAPLLRTNAALAAAQTVGGVAGRLGGWLRWVPPPARDGAYRVVARLRHRWFGPFSPKRPLGAEQQACFLP